MSEMEKWYLTTTYEEAKSIIQENLVSMKQSFIAVGYFLKHIRDNEMYKSDGYASIWEFAQDNYGIGMSAASRWMKMNDKFSQNGNSPVLDEQYRGFEKSQLQEMLYLDNKQLKEVKPDMTVKEIREVRKPEEPTQETRDTAGAASTHPIDRGCITEANPNGNCVCCGSDGVECCGQCEKDCNGRCGWIGSPVATSQQENPESVVDMNPPEEAPEPEVEVIAEENVEVVDTAEEETAQELYEETSERSDMDILRDELNKANGNLKLMSKCYSEKDIRMRKQKLIVGALAGMICELENENVCEQEQPDFPVLRNNDQRKEWLREYKDWGLWYEDEHIGARFYKYDFENGARLIAEEYTSQATEWCGTHTTAYMHLIGGPEPPKDKSGCVPRWNRNKIYNRYPNSETELVEFLKYVQKEER